MKSLVFCADDYSQSPSISGAILRLVENGRLNAVSCLSGSPTWQYDSRNLLPFHGGCQIGLHFNLTHPFGQPAFNVSTILLHSFAGTLRRPWIRKRLATQWDAFEKRMGRAPDFIDGHQHVHLFPGVREVVADFVEERSPGIWIRSLTRPPGRSPMLLKRSLLDRMNRSFSELLAQRRLKSNPFFQGLRNYARRGTAAENFSQWIGGSPDGTLIMCHPGFPSRDRTDPIRDSRAEEFEYLSSPGFLRHLSETGCELALPTRITPR